MTAIIIFLHLIFDGVGLDFTEGKKTVEIIEKNGFANDKILFLREL